MAIFAVAGRLAVHAIAKPVPNRSAGSMAMPLARKSSFPNSNRTTDLDAITSHGRSIRQKILRGLDNYEMNTGMVHPFAVRRSNSESDLGTRGASVPLTAYQDDIWTGKISIGTPPKTLNVQIDTGSADMWVLQTGCAGISGDRDLWDPISSESSKNQNVPFGLQYSDRSIVRGGQYTDNVTIAGFTADPQTFGSATSYASQSTNEYPADGLLGLAFPSFAKLGGDPLLGSLVGQNRLINPTFSLKLSSSGAEMYIGGANSMLYNGDIAYTPVTNPGLWQVSMDDVRVGNNPILKNVPTMFDTGASYIFGDWERVSELYRHLGATLSEYRGYGFYSLPCDSFPTMSFTVGGTSFEIPPELLRLNPVKEGSPNCFSAIVAERAPISYWAVGNTFLQGVYSVFDYSSLRVGFAKLA